MAIINGLRRNLTDIHTLSNLDTRLLPPLTLKLVGATNQNISTNKIEEPTTYVTQETIDAANREDSAPNVPSATDCCGDGCQNCVWLEYVYKVKFHFKHDETKIKAALRQIPSGDTKAFVEFELKKRAQREKGNL